VPEGPPVALLDEAIVVVVRLIPTGSVWVDGSSVMTTLLLPLWAILSGVKDEGKIQDR
jgi:hypothetical protein